MNSVAEWQKLFETYHQLLGEGALEAASPLLSRFPDGLGEGEKDLFLNALRDEKGKWFVLSVLRERLLFPEWLVAPLARAAVYTICPSDNRCFIDPVTQFYGRRRAYEELFPYTENGTDFEKAGAIHLFYWVGRNAYYTIEDNEPVELDDDVSDLRERVRNYLLEEFVRNSNVEVRRNIIAMLSFDTSLYPVHLRPLVPKAANIARRHSDSYIRQRLEVQLGNTRLFSALPHRKKKA